MPGPITEKQRRDAVIKAAKDWIAKHNNERGKGGQTRGALAGQERGITISQQKLGWAASGQKIGPQLSAEVAALYDTTPDGLVRYLLGQGGEEVPLRDIPGWARAKAAAMEAHGDLADAWSWAAVDHVTVPFKVAQVDKEFVLYCVHLVFRWGRVSGVREKVSARQ